MTEKRSPPHVPLWVACLGTLLVGLRFLLELFAANPAAPFVQFVYRLSAGLMAPFYAVFPTQRIQGSVFDWSALLAMVVYGLVAWATESENHKVEEVACHARGDAACRHHITML